MLRIKDIHHVVYRHRDLAQLERFLTDFGMVTVQRSDERLYMRGTGTGSYVYVAERSDTPALGAIAFELEDADQLELAARLPGASKIEAIDGPGGGRRVALTDPGGRRIELLHGVEPAAPLAIRPALTINTCDAKPRRGDLQRPPKGPAQVMRIGHAALGVTDLQRCMDWYAQTLGLLPSDYIVEPGGDHPVAVFMRLNRGEQWTDHHTVAMFIAPEDHVHHVSFEVQDLDAQQLGNQWMTRQGWTPFWGIGRHVLGSQIFDYWVDPSGNLIEHFTDGDLLTEQAPPGYTTGSDESLYTWGPDMTVGHFLAEALERGQAEPRSNP
jgi:catechol 2,3-dioxygenase-like lactoylglutathione lyase family enzyme